MSKLIYTLAFLLAVAATSCGGNSQKKTAVFVDTDDTSDTEEVASEEITYTSGSDVVVPYRSEGGVKYVPVKVNGVSFEMIFDTGCSGALISVAEANYLYQKGKLSQDDIQGWAQSQIADGSIVENMVVNLQEVVIDDKLTCPNVQATVSSNTNAPLLLGNEVLDRVATIKIDNENETLVFTLK